MTESGSLTSFGGKRYCVDSKFAVSKVFAEGSIEREYMVEQGLLTLFGEREYCGGRKFTVSKVFTVGSIKRECMAELGPLWYEAAALVTKIRPRLSNLTLKLVGRAAGSLSS